VVAEVPRLRRLVQSERIFFITTNLKKGLRDFSPVERDQLCYAIDFVRNRRRFRLPSFVVMPDHIHLLVLPDPEDMISALMQALKQATARRVNLARKRTGTIWQKGFFDRFMRTPKEFSETLDYIHNNAVRKGSCATPVEWRWSSARAYADQPSIIAVDFIELPAQAEIPLW
jgi:REP element-mobilizing transposase RayT